MLPLLVCACLSQQTGFTLVESFDLTDETVLIGSPLAKSFYIVTYKDKLAESRGRGYEIAIKNPEKKPIVDRMLESNWAAVAGTDKNGYPLLQLDYEDPAPPNGGASFGTTKPMYQRGIANYFSDSGMLVFTNSNELFTLVNSTSSNGTFSITLTDQTRLASFDGKDHLFTIRPNRINNSHDLILSLYKWVDNPTPVLEKSIVFPTYTQERKYSISYLVAANKGLCYLALDSWPIEKSADSPPPTRAILAIDLFTGARETVLEESFEYSPTGMLPPAYTHLQTIQSGKYLAIITMDKARIFRSNRLSH
ncbi:MAG: hypothetical protein KF836_14025 [Fimbriimonadaceae bacterium]|nr:hypothetical protein [Fimbriimonadaceae bacterium]